MSDQYRISLFKTKIREALSPAFNRVRLYRCLNCSQKRVGDKLFFRVRWDYGHEDSEENGQVAMTLLSRAGIQADIIRDPFGLYWHKPETERPFDSISISIDQPALPERKRA